MRFFLGWFDKRNLPGIRGVQFISKKKSIDRKWVRNLTYKQALVAAVTCFFKLYTINDYGVAMHSDDEYIRGEAYLLFSSPEVKIILMFLMISTVYQQTTLKQAIETIGSDYKKSFLHYDLTGSIGGIISALGCYISHQKLGLMGVMCAMVFCVLSVFTLIL